MLRAALMCSLAATPLLADVVPHCGGPTVSQQAPGQECGHRGPRWRGDCVPPGACFRVEEGGAVCTAACAADVDCAPLGAGFTCSASGEPYAASDSSAAQRLCRRPAP